ncbi:MAG: carboxymuconolactone decarboxylase family protein [[Clostridium] sporosphaeroides]|uniref:Carboxymuconolactone decarboxylase family protein n=2 Tax=Faecalispora sporosphaeroides TaxID=1549 RepID=A0A928KTR2_9FIRM|nr:carboxymuconolactone decarboxylase family protein [Faecalispora sporosphaeroides]
MYRRKDEMTMEKVTNGFELLMTETNGVGQAFMDAVFQMSEKSALEKKTQELAYIAVLVSTRMYGGLPFHIHRAAELGASKEEIKSAMLVPLPIVGIQVADALPYLAELTEKPLS